ncbi:MAG: hypothetical protein C5S38_04500 [Candidatus Methanophagaceae archaeon]|nr:MAG: hypothetical protein C5S38_04500 [Methanophagales archaeon]
MVNVLATLIYIFKHDDNVTNSFDFVLRRQVHRRLQTVTITQIAVFTAKWVWII